VLVKLDELDQCWRFRARNPNGVADAERMKRTLTATLPGAGRSRDQARYVHFGAVGGVVEGPTVVTVVVKTVLIWQL
jgi:hypothetical protein